MSIRSWISVITFVLIGVVLYFSREELAAAWELMTSVNLWILAIVIPVQLFVYFAAGEMMFSYLKAKGSLERKSPMRLARLALEMNFVNHVLPSGGVSGISYMNWRLVKIGVAGSRALMSQIVRYSMLFVAMIILSMIAVIIITIDGEINRWVIFVSGVVVTAMVGAIVALTFLFATQNRMRRFSRWVSRAVNSLVRKVTFGRHKHVLNSAQVEVFVDELHDDYLALRREKKRLRAPLLWGLAFVVGEIATFFIVFLALGELVNPAPIVIAYALASIAGVIVITPGGTGVYEAIMVTLLMMTGMTQGVAIAGIVLTRAIILFAAIGLGYLFYQHAIIKYGRPKDIHPTV